jgi:hypothetical protein
MLWILKPPLCPSYHVLTCRHENLPFSHPTIIATFTPQLTWIEYRKLVSCPIFVNSSRASSVISTSSSSHLRESMRACAHVYVCTIFANTSCAASVIATFSTSHLRESMRVCAHSSFMCAFGFHVRPHAHVCVIFCILVRVTLLKCAWAKRGAFAFSVLFAFMCPWE